MKPVIKVIAGVFAATSALTGVAQAQSYRNDSPQAYEYRQLGATGVVESIETIQGTQQGNKVAGTILGGVIGGVLGHQIGSGRGNDVATVAGALGGAAVGHNIGENKGTHDSYRLTVRMDNGDMRVVQQDSLGDLRTGDVVRLDGNYVTLYTGERGYPPADAYVAPAPEVIYQTDERIEYRPSDQPYQYRRDIDDSGYRYRP